MKDFEGWQGRSDYKAYIDNLFAVNVPTKFIQHYKVTQWENGKAVEMIDDKQQTYNWVPGMKTVLKDESNENTLTIERKSNDFANDKDGYRTRTMTLNGKKIFEGKPGDEKYLFPWSWDQNGKNYQQIMKNYITGTQTVEKQRGLSLLVGKVPLKCMS